MRHAFNLFRGGFLIAALLILALPVVASGYWLGLATSTGAIAISAVGLVLLYGFAHQLALGQAAFCIVGAYGSGLLTSRLGLDPTLAALVSVALSVTIAYAIGGPILRLRGYVLAMASLAVQLILIHLAVEWLDVTGGSMGLTGLPHFGIGGFRISSDLAYYYLTWSLVLVCVAACRNIDRSRIGRALRALSVSEAGAASVGIDIARAKLEMFVLSAAMASIAGSVTAHYLRLIEPQVFSVQYSLNLLIGVIIGGLSSAWGGPVGAIVLALLREATRVLSLPLVEVLVVGVVTVAALIFFPSGLMGLLERAAGTRRKTDPSTTSEPMALAAKELPYSVTAPPTGPTAPILTVRGASCRFGSLQAVDDVSFDVERGSITALLGPNGAGKTTLFNLISGHERLASGTVTFEGQDIQSFNPDRIARTGMARTFQLLQLFGGLSVEENVMCGRQRFASASLAAVVAGLPGQAAEERAMRARAREFLETLGLASVAEADPRTLPFGLQRQVELARALAAQPSLLLMDEPASGLNDNETEQLAELILRIRAAGTTILLVEHDIRLVMGLADHIVVMDRGRKLAEGPPAEIRRSQLVLDAYLGGH